jgi:peroxiredoxin
VVGIREAQKIFKQTLRAPMTTNIYELPANLPIPEDDGAANHLVGMRLPSISLLATNGISINLSAHTGKMIIYCYPMTGKPNVPLPEGWDDIAGARGCTPQSCAYRDRYGELKKQGYEVFALSTQQHDYQLEMAERLALPFLVLSDHQLDFGKALTLPTFEVAGMTLLKRLTMIIDAGVIKAVHYPIFPSHSDPEWVMQKLEILSAQSIKDS